MSTPSNRLNSRFHSLSESERLSSLRELAIEAGPDAARELIGVFQDCEWRETRLEILKLLGTLPSQRTLEFLIQESTHREDPAMAEAALRAMGQTRSPLAVAYLCSAYLHGDAALKPAVASALALVPDRRLLPLMLKDLVHGLKHPEESPKLTRQLIFALGELKCSEALPLIEGWIEAQFEAPLGARAPSTLIVSALLSFGKLSRDPAQLDSWNQGGRAISADTLEAQVFSAVRNQVQARSSWRLEDYLQRLFAKAEPHPALPLELASFKEADVLEGLGLFQEDSSHFIQRSVLALRHFHGAQVTKTYTALAALKSASDPVVLGNVLYSLAFHRDPALLPLLESLSTQALASHEANSPLFPLYLQALALSQPDATAAFRKLKDKPAFSALGEEGKMAYLNAVTDHGLATQLDPQEKQKTVALLAETLNVKGINERFQGRVLRALGRLQAENRTAADFCKTSIMNAPVTASALAYLEGNPSRNAISLIAQVLQSETLRKNFATSALRALRTASHKDELPDADKLLTPLTTLGDEAQSELLRLLSLRPLPALLSWVEKKAKEEDHPRLRFQAVITLKAYASESSADILAPLLNSKDPSLKGRALDTLTHLAGLRPRRVVMDFLKENPKDLDAVDKISRSLLPTDTSPEYFYQTVEGILKANPDHPLEDSLIALRDRFKPSITLGAPGSVPLSAEVSAVELGLKAALPSYDKLEESVKSALRSAEMPFVRPEFYSDAVDKAASVLEFCKALDLQLEKVLGRGILFPKIERSLHEFQTVIHAVGLGDDSAQAAEVMRTIGVNESFTVDQFPLHKMRMLAIPFLTGKIVHDRLRTLDGLRAWAVILLLFARKLPGAGGQIRPPLTLSGVTDGSLVQMSKRLIQLQELRNPAAHRQTYLKLAGVAEARKESLDLIRQIQNWSQT